MMELRKVLWLRGPNIWGRFPTVEIWGDFGPYAPQPADDADFRERLGQMVPSLAEHAASNDRAMLFGRLYLEIQKSSRAPVAMVQAVATAEAGVFRVAVQFDEELHAKQCLDAALAAWQAADEHRALDLQEEIKRLSFLHNERNLGPSSLAIVEPARRRGIPVHRLHHESKIQLGDGVHQRRIATAVTSNTSSVAQHISRDKVLTKALLRQVGLPVPEGRDVSSAEDAWQAACEVGLPVAVKPRDGNQGRGVTLNLTQREHVLDAYRLALREAEEGVIVERFAQGVEHRVLIVDGRFVAAARGGPEQVVGDGRRTVAELVDELNQDPRRGDYYLCPWERVRLDDIALVALDQQQLRPDSIPEAGRIVILHLNGDLTADCTDEVHPEVARACVSAARVIGLDVAGIDLIMTDIGRPLEEQGGIIVEVNAGPGLNMHLVPLTGKPRPVGEAILDTLFPAGATGRIPLVAVLGSEATTTSRRIAALLRQAGGKVGLATSAGTFLDDRSLHAGDGTTFRTARDMLLNPWVEMLVLETSTSRILSEGIGFQNCDAAVVLSIDDFDAARVVVESVSPTGVALLNRDDPRAVELAAHCKGAVQHVGCGDLDVVAEAVVTALQSSNR